LSGVADVRTAVANVMSGDSLAELQVAVMTSGLSIAAVWAALYALRLARLAILHR